MNDTTLVPHRSGQLAHTLDALAAVPEENIWLASHPSPNTRRAYRRDVAHFMALLNITTPDQLRRVDHKAVVAWEVHLREVEQLQPNTIRRKLSALSSLFTHLVNYGAADDNPVREIKRPKIDRREGMTLAFSQKQARQILDAPPADTIRGLRNRAILSVGLQVGLRREEITTLKVRALHQNRGYDSLWVKRKGRKRQSIAIHSQVSQRIEVYLDTAGHTYDLDGPMFRPLHPGPAKQTLRRHLDPDTIDRIIRKYARKVCKLKRGYSAHSMRATFITTALNNGASLEDVQRAAGHADPSTTKLYDKRGINPEKSASFFATY